MNRNEMYEALASIQEQQPQADMASVAVGLGASQAFYVSGVLQITMVDGSGFAFI